jgi:hypothetical protein
MRSLLLCAPLGLCLILTLSGCGQAKQEYQVPADAKPYAKTELVKGYLDTIAKTGELDSGVSTLPDRIEELRDTGNPNIDQLKKDAQELASMSQPAQISALAKKMSAMIPSSTAPAADASPAPAPATPPAP